MNLKENSQLSVNKEIWSAISQLRATESSQIAARANCRKRRLQPAPDGRLVVLAADHPARGVTRIGDNPLAMGDRPDLLGRILSAMSGGLDGVMAPPDVLEDLLAYEVVTGESVTDDRLLIGCMQRGGLSGAIWELDDRFTSYTARALKKMRADGGKMMVRIQLDDTGTLNTLVNCAQAVDDLVAHDLLVFLEPMPTARSERGYHPALNADQLIRDIGISQALGSSTQKTWLKVPYVEEFEKVARATTLPLLLLGGEAAGSPNRLLNELKSALRAGPNVRGALVGRNVLYPGNTLEPAEVATEVASIVHD